MGRKQDLHDRLSRARSWIEAAGALSLDQRHAAFVFLFIAFNALYGRRHYEGSEADASQDREEFLRRLRILHDYDLLVRQRHFIESSPRLVPNQDQPLSKILFCAIGIGGVRPKRGILLNSSRGWLAKRRHPSKRGSTIISLIWFSNDLLCFATKSCMVALLLGLVQRASVHWKTACWSFVNWCRLSTSS